MVHKLKASASDKDNANEKSFIMMKAIQTKYFGPIHNRGSRIKAIGGDNSVSLVTPYDHELNEEQNHQKAAQNLCDKTGWKNPIVGGYVNNSYVWVFVTPTDIERITNETNKLGLE